MKKAIILLIIFCTLYLIGIPRYTELNNLAIIETVGVSYEESKYYVYLKEVIPVKDDQGIKYEYKYYTGIGDDVEEAYSKLVKKASKKIYLNKSKLLITNINDSPMIEEDLNHSFKTIYHPNIESNILEEIKNH